jgi:hypothetical protein
LSSLSKEPRPNVGGSWGGLHENLDEAMKICIRERVKFSSPRRRASRARTPTTQVVD